MEKISLGDTVGQETRRILRAGVVFASAMVIAVMTGIVPARAEKTFDPGNVPFSVAVGEHLVPFRVFAVFILPSERVSLEALGDRSQVFEVEVEAGRLTGGGRSWQWRAPQTEGLYQVRISERTTEQEMLLNVFVMVPFEQVRGQRYNGYHIGPYPSLIVGRMPRYTYPAGFVEVTQKNEGTPVSPHFTLGQFLCPQESNYPKYLVLDERLLLKLEHILERVNSRGIHAASFAIANGYRTPFYNKIAGDSKYSLHQWGEAADIVVDVKPRDGMMDDLNGDGVIDVSDAAVLYGIIDELAVEPWYAKFVGGLALRRKRDGKTPFVHVDLRDRPVRWGE